MPILESKMDSAEHFQCRPGYASELAKKVDDMLDLLDRVDTQIDIINYVMNGAQPPASGKLGVYRDKAIHVGIAGYPRLVEWRWTKNKKWIFKAIGNSHLAKKAKSRDPFHLSYRIMKVALSELDVLLALRGNIIERLTNMSRSMGATNNIISKLEEVETISDALLKDSKKLFDSDWSINSKDFGY